MRIQLTFLATSAVALALPGAALAYNHRVVPFKTVAGIPLKLTPAEVRHRLGRPSHVTRVSGKVAQYDYDSKHLSIQFDTLQKEDRADFVGVNDGSYRTVHGIHLGSSSKAVRHAFGGALKCEADICALYEGKPGSLNSTRTDFSFFEGKLASMDIQYVFKDF
jgi:hypothetical protein